MTVSRTTKRVLGQDQAAVEGSQGVQWVRTGSTGTIHPSQGAGAVPLIGLPREVESEVVAYLADYWGRITGGGLQGGVLQTDDSRRGSLGGRLLFGNSVRPEGGWGCYTKATCYNCHTVTL